MKDRYVFPTVFFLSLLLAQPLRAEKPREIKRVLVLYSMTVGLPADEETDRGMHAAFRSSFSFDVQLYPEYLDHNRFNGADKDRTFADYLRRKYSGIKIDAIITVHRPAVQFLLSEKDNFFPGVPIVVSQIDRILAEQLERSPLRPNLTGIVMGDNAPGLLADSLRLRPGTRRIALVGGASPGDSVGEEFFRKALIPYQKTLEVIDLTKLPMREILARVGTLPVDTIVFFSSMFEDGKGRSFIPCEALTSVSRASNAPVFGLYDTFLGHGIVGGRLVNFEQLGRESATVALRILSGASPASIPFGGDQAYVSLFDWRELKRWKIPESALPPGAKILYREPPVWEEHQQAIIGVVVLIVFESFLILGLVRNLRMRQRAERYLRESEAKFRSYIQSAPLAIFVADRDGRLTDFNAAAIDLLGYDDPILKNMHILDLHPEDDRDVVLREFTTLRNKGGVETELRMKKKDGQIIWVSLHVVMLSDCFSLGYCQDITERRLMREQITAAVEQWQATFDSIHDMVMILDPEFRILRVNTRAVSFFDLPLSRIISSNCHALMHGSTSPIGACPVEEMFKTGRHEEMEIYHEGKHAWLLVSADPILDPTGKLLSVVHTAKDITDRKQAEQEIARQRYALAHVTRVSTVSQLASSIAHELNQPLGAILRNAEAGELLLQVPSPDLDEIRAILADIRKDNQRAGEVIDRMRGLMKQRQPERLSLDINLLADETVTLVQPDADRRRVRLAVERYGALLPVRGDRVQLQQILLNLLLNAMDAMKDNPPSRRLVTVRTSFTSSMAEVSVSDCGCGISEEALLHVFEPFFTSKPEGLGMGLTISRSIVEEHGGQLWAKNNVSGGTTFTFTLPVTKGGDAK